MLDPPASTSCVLGLQILATMPRLVGCSCMLSNFTNPTTSPNPKLPASNGKYNCLFENPFREESGTEGRDMLIYSRKMLVIGRSHG